MHAHAPDGEGQEGSPATGPGVPPWASLASAMLHAWPAGGCYGCIARVAIKSHYPGCAHAPGVPSASGTVTPQSNRTPHPLAHTLTSHADGACSAVAARHRAHIPRRMARVPRWWRACAQLPAGQRLQSATTRPEAPFVHRQQQQAGRYATVPMSSLYMPVHACMHAPRACD